MASTLERSTEYAYAVPPACFDLGPGLLELVGTAGDQDRDRPGGRELQRSCLADAARAAGDDDGAAAHRTGQRAVAVQIGIEVALPVVPERRRVVGEFRHRDAASGKGAFGVAGVEARHERDVRQHLFRDPEIAEHLTADLAESREFQRCAKHSLGKQIQQRLVDAQRHLRRVAGSRERVDDVTRAHPPRAGQVERLPVQSGLVRDVIHGGDDVIDRDDVGVTELRAGQRHPFGQQVAHFLDGLEEVVRPVDLVHLAGLAVPDDDRRTVDPPRHLGVACAPGARTRTSCGDTTTAAAGPRRTCPRGSSRRSHRRPRSS